MKTEMRYIPEEEDSIIASLVNFSDLKHTKLDTKIIIAIANGNELNSVHFGTWLVLVARTKDFFFGLPQQGKNKFISYYLEKYLEKFQEQEDEE